MHGDSLLMLTTKVVSNKKPPLLSDSESGGNTSPKPDHKLTIEEKRKIVEYELDLEEKKQTLLASISSNGS